MKALVPHVNIQQLIYLIRGQKVMLDRDLAALYGVPTGVLNQAVKRNRKRFPTDFMFQLSRAELENWKSQTVISNPGLKMGLRKAPYAFTEHGVAMLSSVLSSDRAVQVNIAIIRAFIELRRTISAHRELAKKIAEHEKRITGLTSDVRQIINLIHPLLDGPAKRLQRIGFRSHS
jgi:hypothetical protein